jgi:hypothetical protein
MALLTALHAPHVLHFIMRERFLDLKTMTLSMACVVALKAAQNISFFAIPKFVASFIAFKAKFFCALTSGVGVLTA